MKRLIDKTLKNWKDSRIRQPLLVRGARQVGKTFSVSAFGKAEFNNLVIVNFEEQPEMANCFSDYNPKAIIDRISILKNAPVTPGKTLLFLDEIQECPKAITSLRYFYEKMPELHVIGAGSLVEFALRSENFRMPVGRIQSIFMHPLSFEEFLIATGEERLSDYLQSVTSDNGVEAVYHARLLSILRQFLMIGGMPAVVKAFTDNLPPGDIQLLQNGIIRTYADDFSKYASAAKHKYLKEVYLSAPRMTGQRYKYSHVNRNIESKFLKDALNLLCQARCLSKICHTSGAGVPLESGVNDRKFKVLFLDIGLMQNALGLHQDFILNKSLMQINAGSVAEQYVGQELLSSMDPYTDSPLYFWVRDAKGSSAEVDYLVESNGVPLPAEVKAGKTGTLKSMKMFFQTYPACPFGIRYSMHNLSYHDNVLSIPLYMVNQTQRLINDVISNNPRTFSL